MNQLVVLIYSITLCLIARADITERKLRITNNDFARPGEFPYQVSLQQAGQHICGGSLISNRHVLTAAHCFYAFLISGQPIWFIKAVVGTSTIYYGGILKDVDRIAYHPDYRQAEYGLNADVAVARLASPVVESPYVKIIALPSPDFKLQPHLKFIISGFGSSMVNGTASPYLKKLVMMTVPRSICRQYWNNYYLKKGIFCAISPSRAGICQGDSGGPLTIGQKVVVGIASGVSNHGCGAGIPDLFTRVTTYLNFIESEMSL